MSAPYFLGIDIGTQGARVVLLDGAGNVVGSQEEAFPLNDKSREEQSPQEWWQASLRSLKALFREAGNSISLADIKQPFPRPISRCMIADHNRRRNSRVRFQLLAK